MKITKNGSNYLIAKGDGTNVVLTCMEAGLLVNFIGKENLRAQIEDRVEEAESDWLDLTNYEGTRDEFIQEIFAELEDEIAEALDIAGVGAKVDIYDLFPDATVYYYSGTYDIELVNKIYDALMNHIPVTVNDINIVDI